MEATRKRLTMTEGPLFGKILLFVLPIMATNLLQVLYNAADMVTVSLSTEPDAVGAIGTTGAFITLIVNIFIGFATGANVMVARHIGARDADSTSRTVHTALLMSVLFGAVGTVIGLLLSHPMLALMGNTGKLLALATTYTRIYFLGVPFISVTNYAIAIFRAKGDTKTPLLVLTATGLLNVALNLFLVLVCHLSVEGVSISTTVSNAVSMVVLLFKLSRSDDACRFSPRLLRLDRRAFLDIIRIGVPAGIQGALFSVSNMLIQSAILQVNNTLCSPTAAYQPVVKGNAAAANLEGFAYTATNSVYQAAVTFTGQNVGAAKYERVWRVMRCCYLITFFVAVISGAVLILFRVPLLALYGVVDGPEGSLEHLAMYTATVRTYYMIIPYFTLAFMEVGSGILRGMGHSTTSTVISLIGACLSRIVWINTVFRLLPTLEIIYISYPITWALTAATSFLFSVRYLRRLIKTRELPAPAA